MEISVVYYNKKAEYVTENIINIDPEKELIKQVNIAKIEMSKKLEQPLDCKVYTDRKTIFVSVYMGGVSLPLQNKVALRVDSNDDILRVSYNFSEEIKKEEKVLNIYTEIYLSI